MTSAPNELNAEYREKRPTPPMDTSLLVIGAVLTVFMAFLAVSGLLPDSGFGSYAKAGVIAIMAGGVSFAVNHYAIERGAPLAATGYLLASIFSVCTILIVGSGISASTYAGMTMTPVNELRLHDSAQDVNRYAGAKIKTASEATRTKPVIQSIAADLRAKVECEIQSACLSGRGGGRGPVTRAIENLAARADQVAVQLEQGDRQRLSIVAGLNDELGRFQSTLNDTSKSYTARREALVQIDTIIDQGLSDLSEAVPTSLLVAYASELSNGVAIPGLAQASQAASVILTNHGRALESVLGTLEAKPTPRPTFPAQAGVSSTFSYIAHFLPIAAIVVVVELVLPLTLWVYTFIGIVWDKETATRRSTRENVTPNAPNVTQFDTAQKRRPRRARNHGNNQNGRES